MSNIPFWKNFELIARGKSGIVTRPFFAGARTTTLSEAVEKVALDGDVNHFATVSDREWESFARAVESRMKRYDRFSLQARQLFAFLIATNINPEGLRDALWDHDAVEEELMALAQAEIWMPIVKKIFT